jgi:redox-sensitive bicupin YhaK (pirin superfamily)
MLARTRSAIRPAALALLPSLALSLSLSTMAAPSTPAVQASIARAAGRVTVARKQREGGGFIVRRPFPSGSVDNLGGLFLMFDHFGPVPRKDAVGAPDHPHRGFITVTYILEGAMHHQDSAGNEGLLSSGMVQILKAGSGVVHSEMPLPPKTKEEESGSMEGFQLWVNLPAALKMSKPHYQDIAASTIPVRKGVEGWKSADSQVRVIAGSFGDTTSTAQTHTPFTYLDVQLGAGDSISQTVPSGHAGFAYVYRGRGVFGSNRVEASEGTMVELGATAGGAAGASGAGAGTSSSSSSSIPTTFTVSAASDSPVRVLLIYGEPINEPIARYGPFVMNTQQEIRQAFADFQSGRMGAIDGEEERLAATEAARQAQKASGRWEKDSRDL